MSFRNKKKQKLKNFGAFEKLDKLQEAHFLIENEEWFEALKFLEAATQKYPSDVRFWEMLAAVGSELRDISTMQKSFAKLTQFQPNDADAWFGLAFAYGLDSRLALSYSGFRDFLKKFPTDEKSAEAAEMVAMAEKDLRRNLLQFDFPDGDEGVELACLHEEAQILMNRHSFEEAKEKAFKLISRMPDFIPVYNNLSLIYFMNGEAETAAETARKVLDKQPENFHALANLARFYVFLGQPDEARNFSNRLRPIKNDNPDLWIKKIEAFTFVGDDQAVVEVYKEANKKSEFAVPESFGKHLAAFAFYQLGKESKARKLWMEILDDDPNFEFAEQNLEELHLAQNERNIFALPINYWIPARYINDLMAETGKIKDGKNFEKNLQKKLARFFEKNPNILHVLSILLERGDESAKEFSVNLMSWAATTESFAALKDFAFGQKGSDEMRYKAAMKLSEAEQISNKVRLWNDGEWREMILMTFEITGEPTDIYPMQPKAQGLLGKGLEAMQKQNPDLAAQYFQMALEANGSDHPSLLYNLLAIKQTQGSRADADNELRELVRKFPDYSFAAISLATSEVKKGNIEAAKNLVERFYEKKKWHFSEIKVWFYFNLEMALEERHFDSARMSLDMLQKFDENLDYKYWDELISRMELLDKLSAIPSKLLGRKKKKK
ncbi:MAG: tetratricopeptide repeat protein [Pyrinomonadaceae bacterium]